MVLQGEDREAELHSALQSYQASMDLLSAADPEAWIDLNNRSMAYKNEELNPDQIMHMICVCQRGGHSRR